MAEDSTWSFDTAGRLDFYRFSKNDRRAEKIIENGRTCAPLFGARNFAPTGTSRFTILIAKNTKNAIDSAYGVGVALETCSLEKALNWQSCSYMIFVGNFQGTLYSESIRYTNYLNTTITEGMNVTTIVDMDGMLPTLRYEVNWKPVGVPWQMNLSPLQRKHLRPAVELAWANDTVELI